MSPNTTHTTWWKTPLILVGVFACGYAFSVLWYVSTTPDIGLRCSFSPVINRVDPSFFIDPEDRVPGPGDKLVKVGNTTFDEKEDGGKHWAQVDLLKALILIRDGPKPDSNEPAVQEAAPSGEIKVLVKFRRPSETKNYEIWCRLGTIGWHELVPSILWFSLKVGLLLVGALVFWKRPSDASAAQFFLLCIVAVGAYMGGYHWVRIATEPPLLLIFMVCAVLLAPVGLHFYLVFPQPKEFFRRHPIRTLLANYLVPLLFLIAMVVSYGRLRRLYVGEYPEAVVDGAWSVLSRVIHVYLMLSALWYVAGVVCLIHSYRSAANLTERNQVKWIMGGSMLGLVPIGYTLYLVLLDPDQFGAGAATWPMFAASLFWTVAFAVSITRYRLMQLDQFISSSAIYFFLSFVAGLVYYAMVLAGIFAADLLGNQVSPGPSLLQTLWVSASFLILLVLLDLARGRIMKALDRRFYREKHQLDRTLRRMGQAIEQLVDPPTLARRLLQASADLLNVSRGAVYLREGDPPLFRLAGNLGPAPALTELSPGCPLVETLNARGALIDTADSETSADPARRQLRFIGGEVAHALAHEGKLLALLVLGPKDLGTYGVDDINLLSAFAQLTALALESAEGHRTIEGLNRELQSKVEKISEQQRRILALQSQLMRQSSRPSLPEGTPAETTAEAAQAPPGGIVGSGPAVRHLLDMVRKTSASQAAVLIRGESGTGKGILAQALHDRSARAGKPFVKVLCTALAPGLLESELFGHVKGAFTGAHRDKVGRFELANGGSVFLDEIGDINLEVQTKLLRVLEEKTFERVGSSDSLRVDVRIIAATHQNLEELIRQGRFREDLYYRLKVIDIVVPPLRDRGEDIPGLAQHFLQLHSRQCGKTVEQIDDDALVLLKTYHWPGNIRELENVMERAVVVVEGSCVTVQDLPEELLQTEDDLEPALEPVQSEIGNGVSLTPAHGIREEREDQSRRERELLVRALAAARGNKAEAARALGMARSTLVSRLKKFGLS